LQIKKICESAAFKYPLLLRLSAFASIIQSQSKKATDSQIRK